MFVRSFESACFAANPRRTVIATATKLAEAPRPETGTIRRMAIELVKLIFRKETQQMIEGLFQPMHLIIILVIVLIVFGAGKLADVGGALGKSVKEFKESTSDLKPGETTEPIQSASTGAAPQAPVYQTQSQTKVTAGRADDL